MEEVIAEFIQHLENSKKFSMNTILSYKRDIIKFYDFLCKYGFADFVGVNKTNILSFVYYLERLDCSKATISRNISSLRLFYSFLMDKSMVMSNPVSEIDIPKIPKTAPDSLSKEEIKRLLEQPLNDKKGIRDKAVLELLYASGIRVSELVKLKVSNINLNLAFIMVGEGENQRIIPIVDKAVEALKNYMETSKDQLLKSKEGVLFTNYKGEEMTRQGVWKIIKKYALKADIENISPNTIRHSFAAHLIENGADLQSVQELMGLKDISATYVYINNKTTQIRDVYNKAHPRA